MSFGLRLATAWAINAAALWVANALWGSVRIHGWAAYLIGAAVLGVANTIIKPVRAVLTLPLIVVTLGFFYLVINIAMVALAEWVAPRFSIDGFWSYVGTVFVVWAVNYVGRPIQDYVQPDTQIEPSIAVNPANPKNVVTVYQEGRIADGGDATNGFATSLDGGKSWKTGELPGLTSYPGQGGVFERASDAVVAFGPNNVVYANSLVFDFNKDLGLRSGIAVNVSKDGGLHRGPPVLLQDDVVGGLNDKNWIVVDTSDAPGHHKGRVYVVWDRVAPVLVDYCDHDCDRLSNWLPDFQTIPNVVFPGQGIGAYPAVLKNGGLGIVMDTITGAVPVPSGPDELDAQPDAQGFIAAPAAG